MLIENGRGEGHGASNAPVRIAGAAKGNIIDAVVTGRDGTHLIGTCK